MIEKNEIKEHMEVIGADGVHVGTVDRLEGERIKLTKQDSGEGSHKGHHHFISLGLVADIKARQGPPVGQWRCRGDVRRRAERLMAAENQCQAVLGTIARRHGVSEDAVSAALDALQRGGGTMAQFSHPDFGGMAQWSKGGMSMVGDMFNSAMKASLDGVLADLGAAIDDGTLATTDPWSSAGHAPDAAVAGGSQSRGWWPAGLGSPSTSGGQNAMRYAFFPDARRLVVDDNGKQTIYDTADHRITGVSQQQSTSQSLTFSSQSGAVRVDDLAVVP